jgi:hypothetical protein
VAESDLYRPVKTFLEKRGYEVKGEVRGCDVVAVKDGAALIVELKQRFTLELILQGVDRLALTDTVYLAVPEPTRQSRGGSPWDKRVVKLCRRVGFGLLTVSKRGRVEVIADPEPYQPRKNKAKAKRLLSEHARRAGDPNLGGINRMKIVTAYRQEALRLAEALAAYGPKSPRDLKAACDAPRAGSILRDNHYGWFERQERGIYIITEVGRAGLAQFAAQPSSSR